MKVYINAKIYTMDEENPEASYLIEKDGRIIEAGKSFEKSTYFGSLDEENIIDVKGNVIVPGFWESHLHLVEGIRALEELNLKGIDSIKELEQSMASYAAKIGENDWIIGHGWDEAKLFGGRFPDRKLLDRLQSKHPIMLIRMDGHSLCLNTKAIELLKLNRTAPLSEMPVDSTGEPSGMLFENAANAAAQKVIDSLSDEYLERLVLKAQELFIQNGITSVNDIYSEHGRYFDLYKMLQKSGKLKIRITIAPNGLSENSLEEFRKRSCEETDRLRIAAPKYFMDGSFGSRTALLTEEYADEQGNFGVQLLGEDQLKEIILHNESINRPITIHAIGDKAVSIILDCIEAARVNNNRDIRNRIEHIQIVQNKDIERFKNLDITASFQPVFLYEKELTLARLGRERFPMVYRFKSFINNGINVIFNSDFPYGGGAMPEKTDNSRYFGFEPILSIHAACYKQLNPPESVEPMQALQCYTQNAAYANYRENELGKLKKGFFADFAVLSENIINCSPEQLLKTEVLRTVINGETVSMK